MQDNARSKHNSNYYVSNGGEESDMDDEGNPKTIAAALRMYHKNDTSKTVYVSKQ